MLMEARKVVLRDTFTVCEKVVGEAGRLQHSFPRSWGSWVENRYNFERADFNQQK